MQKAPKSPKAGMVRLILLGFLLAQLAPQVRVSIHDEGGWKWPAFKLGYNAEIKTTLFDLADRDYWKRAAEENREELQELRQENEQLRNALNREWQKHKSWPRPLAAP